MKFNSVLLVLVIGTTAWTETISEDDAGPFDSDESPEIEVPRSPKIYGPSPHHVRIPEGSIVYNLTCEYSGVPTPKVAWAKNGSEIPAEFKVENYPALGKSVLFFPESAIQNETEVTGNYTCAVANFVSRTQKEYEVLYGTLDEELSTTTAYTQETTQIYESLENTDTTPLITVTEEVMNKTETPRPKKV